VVKEQVESRGAKFLEFDLGISDAEDASGYARALSAEQSRRQQELLAEKMKEFDVVVTTALVPGRPPPRPPPRATPPRADAAESMKECDAVVPTALVPGRPAPRLVPAETVAGMRPGSVIVDLAAEAGGNCELTEPDRVITRHGVTIHRPTNLPPARAGHPSQLYARTVT